MPKLSIASAVNKLIKKKNQEEAPDQSIVEASDQQDDYAEDDLPAVEQAEELDPSKAHEVLQKVSTDVETLIDAVIEVNDNKEYSKLIKLLQSAVRLADELIESDELLDK